MTESESILPEREELAVAFCPRCGQVCDGELPEPGRRWRCSACRRSTKMVRANTAYRLRYLLKLLRSRNERVMAMAQNGLVIYGEISREWLLQELEKRPQISQRIAPVLGRVGGLPAVTALLNGIRRRRWKLRRQKWLWRWLFLAAAIYAFINLHFCIGLFLLAFMSVPSFQKHDRAAIEALEALRDPLAAGPIAVAHRETELQQTTGSALKSLLPLLRSDHAGHVRPGELQAIAELMWSFDRDLAVRAIGALAHVGNARSLQSLRALAEERQTGDAVGDAARAAIPALERQLSWRKEQQQLLRAARPRDDEDSKRLLRPATAGDSEQQQLLRRADDGEAE